MIRLSKKTFCSLFASLGFALAASSAMAQQAVTYQVLHTFGGGVTNADGQAGPDGSYPNGDVAFDSAGNMYGTAPAGGAFFAGAVWEFTKDGIFKDLFDFGTTVTYPDATTGSSGNASSAVIRFDSAGNMYGTTFSGGEYGDGEIWKMTPTGTYIPLHEFGGTVTRPGGATGQDGFSSLSDVSFDASGNMYGTATYDKPNQKGGIVWELTPAGVYTELYEFGGTNGSTGSSQPKAGVALDGSGNIFGTASAGSSIWELTPSGTFNVLHQFGGPITNANGAAGADGNTPECKVIFDASGNMFGTAYMGGPSANGGSGMIWEVTHSGVYIDLHDLGNSVPNSGGTRTTDGAKPASGLTMDSAGNFYGTTYMGGNNGVGVLYKIQLNPVLTSVSLNPSTVVGGSTSTGTVTLSGPAKGNGQLVYLAPSSTNASCPSGVLVPAGATTATFTIHTVRVAASASWTITGSEGSASASATLNIQAAAPSVLSFAYSTVTGGYPTSATITLSGPAPDGGLVVNLSSNSSATSMPSSVTIPSGVTTTSFRVNTSVVTAKATATITAQSSTGSTSSNLTINPKS